MPYKVPNVLSYSPFGHGGGLTRAVANLFGGGPSGADQAKLQAELDAKRAASEYHLSQRDVNNAKIADAERSRIAMEDAPRRVAGAIFGNQPQADLWMKSRETGSLPVAEFTTPVGSQMGPSQAQADVIPAQFDPNLVANATRMLTGIAAARALPGNDNLKHLSDIVGGLFNQEVRQGALNGTVTNPQIQRVGAATAATGGKALYNNLGEAGTFNLFTGEQALNPLGDAKVVTEGAHAGAYRGQEANSRAAAGEHAARARKVGVETEQLRADGLVPVLDPTTRTQMLDDQNNPIMIRGSKRAEILQRGEDKRATRDNDAANAPPKGAQAKAPIKIDPKVLRAELGRLTDEEADKRALDPMFANQVMSRAMALAQESGGEFWNKPVEAVRVALMEATGGKELADITGSWRDRNKRFAPPGFKPQQSGGAITSAPAAGAPAAPAMPKVGEVRKGYRYKGGDPSSPSSWEAAQ